MGHMQISIGYYTFAFNFWKWKDYFNLLMEVINHELSLDSFLIVNRFDEIS